MIQKIGLGGGCHWCTEAVFASLRGVQQVEQGWIASKAPDDAFSEAVIVWYDDSVIQLKGLIQIHLLTHSATSNHSMRAKYRSAVYYFTETDKQKSKRILTDLQSDFPLPLVTNVLAFCHFKTSLPEHRNYYYTNPEKPFCTLYINPKLQMLKKRFAKLTRGVEK